jgi:hypothetical protein
MRLDSRSGRLILRERVTGIYWIGGWMGRRTGLDAVEKRIIYYFCQELKSYPLVVQQVA